MGRTIAVGTDPGYGQVDLILRSYDQIPCSRPGLTVHRVESIPDALFALRQVFADHHAIASLGGARVVGADTEWTTAIENRLCEFIDDLGNCALDSWMGARHALLNGPALANGATTAGLHNTIQGISAICLGAGPSATPEALAQIARLSRKIPVFASDSIVGACLAAGFTPHYVCMIERPPEMARLVEGADRSSILIAPPVVHPDVVAKFDRTCFWWQGDYLYKWLDPRIPHVNAGRSAGTLTIAAALHAGCSRIYLVGHDLAYAPSGGSHAAGTHDLAVTSQAECDAQESRGHYGRSRFQVPGFSGAPVTTNGYWNTFRGDIEVLVAQHPDVRVYSAQGYQGAAIAGVTVGDLPETGPADSFVRPDLPLSGVPDPRARIPSLRVDMARIRRLCNGALSMLHTDPNPRLDLLSQSLAASVLSSEGNAAFFNYVFRAVYCSLALRLHMRAETDHDTAAIHAETLTLLAETLPSLCDRLEAEMPS